MLALKQWCVSMTGIENKPVGCHIEEPLPTPPTTCLPTNMSIYHTPTQPIYNISYITFLLLLLKTTLTSLIVARFPYTEINWAAYMKEVSAY